MPRENLIEEVDEEEEEQTFEEVLKDLDVPVEKKGVKTAKAVSPWLKPSSMRSDMLRGMSISGSYLGFAPSLIEKIMPENSKDNVRIVLRIVEFEGKPAIAIKYNPEGFKIRREKNGMYKMTRTANLDKYLKQYGVQKGRYEVFKIKEGWLAVKEVG